MKVYEVTCTCAPPRRFRTLRLAEMAMRRHGCPPIWAVHRCPNCLRSVPLLVEGSDLCIRCDSFIWPEYAA